MIKYPRLSILTVVGIIFTSFFITGTASAYPTCQRTDSDSDGDGYGWENNQTCLVSQNDDDDNTDSGGQCQWYNSPIPLCIQGEGVIWSSGWGRLGSGAQCVTRDLCENDGESRTYVIGGGGNTGSVNVNDVTDVVLMAGQSNAASTFATNLQNSNSVPIGVDAVDSRIIVWVPTSRNAGSWQVANPCTQVWSHNDYYPGQGKSNWPKNGGNCSNNTLFQIAKQLRRQGGNKKVAIILTGLPGQSINLWSNYGSAGIKEIREITNAALASFSYKRIDLIAWAQGERDVGDYRTYESKLDALIDRLKSSSQSGINYFRNGKFVAQEISQQVNRYNGSCSVDPRKTEARLLNNAIRTLGNDGDSSTDWVAAEYLATLGCSNPHFNGASQRTIGQRIADKYANM